MEKYAFLCLDCGAVVSSNSWEKYHIKENSCPFCKGDMCGCNDCLDFIEEKQLPVLKIDYIEDII